MQRNELLKLIRNEYPVKSEEWICDHISMFQDSSFCQECTLAEFEDFEDDLLYRKAIRSHRRHVGIQHLLKQTNKE